MTFFSCNLKIEQEIIPRLKLHEQQIYSTTLFITDIFSLLVVMENVLPIPISSHLSFQFSSSAVYASAALIFEHPYHYFQISLCRILLQFLPLLLHCSAKLDYYSEIVIEMCKIQSSNHMTAYFFMCIFKIIIQKSVFFFQTMF